MIESPQQIAEDIQTVEKALRSFSDHLAEPSIDLEHIRTRLGDFSELYQRCGSACCRSPMNNYNHRRT